MSVVIGTVIKTCIFRPRSHGAYQCEGRFCMHEMLVHCSAHPHTGSPIQVIWRCIGCTEIAAVPNLTSVQVGGVCPETPTDCTQGHAPTPALLHSL